VERIHQEGDHPVVAMILRGRTRARIRSRGAEHDFCPGPNSVGLFAPRFEIDQRRWEAEPGSERLIVELDLADVERLGDLEALGAQGRALVQNVELSDPRLAALLRRIAQEVRQGSPQGPLYANLLSLSLAGYLYGRHGRGGAERRRERGRLSDAQSARVLEFLELRLAENIDLEDLALVAGTSRFHFLRLFRARFGVTPHRYLLQQRVEAARRMLQETLRPLADVAAATGFSSQSHLSTAMRQYLGASPGQLRSLAARASRR
jgi:AraC family transcriptional regulator